MLCEEPKLGPFRDAMRERLAEATRPGRGGREREVHDRRGHGLRGPRRGHRRAGHRKRRPDGSSAADRNTVPTAMDRDDLAFAGVAALARMVRDGQVSSRELVELYLDRIGRLDPALNTYRIVMAERALADADQADARRRGGDVRPLLGVPIAVKDTEDVAGEVTRWGTAAFSEPAARDGELVSRLRVGRRRAARQDEPPGAGDHRLHRGPRLRRDPQSLGPRRHAGRVERRQRRRGGRRPGRRPPRRRTAPARSASRRPTAGWWASSRSATGSRSRRSPSTGTA